MTQGERVREVRKALKLTLEEFGSKIGMKKGSVSAIETNRNSLTEQVAVSICREYNVNYDYLMEGEGEVFSDLPQTVLDELCKQYNLDDLDRILIEQYLKLPSDDREVLKKYIRNVIDSGKGGD